MRFTVLATAVLLASSLLACSGKSIVEPGTESGPRAKNFLAKCGPQEDPPDDGTGAKYKMVYSCIRDLEECPAPKDALTKSELENILGRANECGATVSVYDIPCGPDLNAIECCYAVRIKQMSAICE